MVEKDFIWLHHNTTDEVVWLGNSDGNYSVAFSYKWLHRDLWVTAHAKEWGWVWRLHTTEKCKFMVWLALHNALPTNSIRF